MAVCVMSDLIATEATSVDDLRAHAGNGRLYAILDACDAPPVPAKVQELGDRRATCLYAGRAEEYDWATAPYLVKVDCELLDWIKATLWDGPWGIFAVADADLKATRRHFRRFIYARSPDGELLYFRYYDPRVLKLYLGTCTTAEIEVFFGPVKTYIVAGGGKGQEMLAFARPGNGTR